MAHTNVDELVGDAPGPYVFRKEGEYWTIAYGGAVFRLRDAKGMTYLAHLLGRPGQSVTAAALFSLTSGRPDGASGERARLAVTQRIKAALTKIQDYDSSLAHHLTTCIRTGHLCTYVPDPGRPIPWVL